MTNFLYERSAKPRHKKVSGSRQPYHKLRRALWADFVKRGEPSTGYILEPAEDMAHDDVYKFPYDVERTYKTACANALKFANTLIGPTDIILIMVKGRWVYVRWQVPSAGTTDLKGGPSSGRLRVTG